MGRAHLTPENRGSRFSVCSPWTCREAFMKMASPVEIHMGSKTDILAQEMLKGKALSPKTLREPRAEPSEMTGRTADANTASRQSWCLVLKLDHKRRLTPVELGSHLLSDPASLCPPEGRVRHRRAGSPSLRSCTSGGHGSGGKRRNLFLSSARELLGAPPKRQVKHCKNISVELPFSY